MAQRFLISEPRFLRADYGLHREPAPVVLSHYLFAGAPPAILGSRACPGQP